MASNYTSNYHLNQWAAEDKVQRVDFNADNAAIEAALTAHARELTATKSKLSTVQSDGKSDLNAAKNAMQIQMDNTNSAVSSLRGRLSALQAQVDSLPTYRVGVLEGYDGSAAVTVDLGKQPKMVMVGNKAGWSNEMSHGSSFCWCGHAVALPGYPGMKTFMVHDFEQGNVLTVTSTGFKLEAGMESGLAPYYYLALL